MAHNVVVGQISDLTMRAQGADSLRPGFGRALGHENHGLQPELAGGPGQTTPVIAVRGRDQGHLPHSFPRLRRPERGTDAVRRQLQTPGKKAGHGPGRAQRLEGFQAETAGLVLDEDPAQTEPGGQTVHAVQGGGDVFRKGGVKTANLRRPRRGERRERSRGVDIRFHRQGGTAGVEGQFHGTHALNPALLRPAKPQNEPGFPRNCGGRSPCESRARPRRRHCRAEAVPRPGASDARRTPSPDRQY